LGRFEQMRANLRYAWRASRESVRARRQRRPAPEERMADEPEERQPEPDPPPGAPIPVDEAVPRSLRIAAAWSWRLIVVGAVAYVVLLLVDRFMILVAPLMIGLLLAGLLAPALRWVLKLRLNRTLATFVVLVAGLAAVGGTLTLVVNQFRAGLDDLIDSAEAGIRELNRWLREGPLHFTDADFEHLLREGQAWLGRNQEGLTQGALGAASATAQAITGIILALVATFFFLRDGGRIWRFLVGILPPPARAPAAYAGEGAWRTLTGYVRATVLVAFIDALGIGVGLWILDVPLAVPLAALVFLGAFVPIVGAFVSGAMAVVVAFVDDGLVKALLVLGVVLLVQQLEGNVLQPVIMSRAVKIHPLAVIIAVTGGIIVGGIIGALVAVPFVAVINTTVRRLNQYRHPPTELGELRPGSS